MTKKDLADKIAEKTGITERLARQLLQTMLDNMAEALVNGNTLEFRDFGVFKTKIRRARLGRNPKAGTAVQVPARRVAVFKAGKELKERIRNVLSHD